METIQTKVNEPVSDELSLVQAAKKGDVSAFGELVKRYEAAGGRFLVCPICFGARHLRDDDLVANASLGGTVPMWEWIGDEPVTTFSY